MNENKTFPQGLEIPDRKNQTRLFKALLLALISILAFGLTWQLLAWGFSQAQGLIFWLYPLATAALGAVFLAFLGVVNRYRVLYLAISGLIFVWYLLVMPRDLFVILGGLIFFGLTFLFQARIQHDEKSRADFSMSRVLRGSRAVMVYALLAVVGFNIYAKVAEEFRTDPKKIYSQIGYYASRGLEHVPNEFAQFDPHDPVLKETVAGWVSEKIEHTVTSYQNFFPLIFAVIVAAFLRSIAFLFVWLVMLVSWVSFKLLLMVKFFRLPKVPVEVEKLEI